MDRFRVREEIARGQVVSEGAARLLIRLGRSDPVVARQVVDLLELTHDTVLALLEASDRCPECEVEGVHQVCEGLGCDVCNGTGETLHAADCGLIRVYEGARLLLGAERA